MRRRERDSQPRMSDAMRVCVVQGSERSAQPSPTHKQGSGDHLVWWFHGCCCYRMIRHYERAEGVVVVVVIVQTSTGAGC